MVKQITPTFGLCLDWETSGSTWGGDSSILNQGISFGAVVFDTKTFSPIETIYHLVKFDSSKYQWSKEAEAIHGITQAKLEAEGISQEDAADSLINLILKYWMPEDEVMFLGHNAPFDISFTNQLTQSIGIQFGGILQEDAPQIKLHHVVLDTAGAGFITTGFHKSDLLFDLFGLETRSSHNALQDALMTLKVCANLKSIFNEILNG